MFMGGETMEQEVSIFEELTRLRKRNEMLTRENSKLRRSNIALKDQLDALFKTMCEDSATE
jgi:hypothetical protein